MAAFLQSNSKFYIKENFTTSLGVGGTFMISGDLEDDSEIDSGGVNTFVVIKNESQLERFSLTIAGGIATIVKRGLKKDGITEDVAFRKIWGEGSIGYITPAPLDFIATSKLDIAGGLRNSMGNALGVLEISATGNEEKKLIATGSSILPTELIQARDPSTRAVKEVTYSSILSDMTSASTPKLIAGESLIAGDLVYVEKLLDFGIIAAEVANAITVRHSQLALGNIAGNTKRSMQIIGNGTSSTTIKLGFKKTGTPADNVTVRIETDDGTGKPSGTLADANATASLAGSGLTTGLVEKTFTWAGAFSLADGVLYHIVVARSSGLDPTNYYSIGLYNIFTRSFLTNLHNGTTWGTAVTTNMFICTFTGAYTQLLAKTSATQLSSCAYSHIVASTTAIGGVTPLIAPGGLSNSFSSLSKDTQYYLSNTAGLISTTPGTNSIVAGRSDTTGTGFILGNSESKELFATTSVIWQSPGTNVNFLYRVKNDSTFVHTATGGTGVIYAFCYKNGTSVAFSTFNAVAGDLIYIAIQHSGSSPNTTLSEVITTPKLISY